MSESSVTSIESLPKIAQSASVCNKSIKRPISKSNSSESGSDPSVTDSNKLTGIPVEVTVSSRVEVKTRLPDRISNGDDKQRKADHKLWKAREQFRETEVDRVECGPLSSCLPLKPPRHNVGLTSEKENEDLETLDNMPETTKLTKQRNRVEERRKDVKVEVQDNPRRMMPIREGILEEFCTTMQQSTLSSTPRNFNEDSVLSKIHFPESRNTAERERLEKIEAIEGWMKLQEEQFSDNHIMKQSVRNIRYQPNDYMQNFKNAINREESDFFTHNECAKVQLCAGSHPEVQREKKSANIKPSQEDAESSECRSFQTLERVQVSQHNKQSPVPQISRKSGQTETKSSINLSSLNVTAKSEMKDGQISNDVEPICQAVRVQPRNCAFETSSRSPRPLMKNIVQKPISLEQIESMIEPKLEEKSCKRKTLESLMPEIVQVKLGLENQSKLLEKLDLMMRESEIGDRSAGQEKAVNICEAKLKGDKQGYIKSSAYRQMSGGRLLETKRLDPVSRLTTENAHVQGEDRE
ncbi:hypothetical protein C0J52_04522 [Blattella germanica]|nr:hypothetical protein C0J52_04522 [Blattella germanica]